MKFSAREDIEAPIAQVFSEISDFRRFERQALRNGVQVQRNFKPGLPAKGQEWQIGVMFRGTERQILTQLAEYEAPTRMRFLSSTKGLRGEGEVELLALSANRTRLFVSLELRPETVAGRVLVQSLKLAKTRLTRKFKRRVSGFAQRIESAVTAP